MMNLLLAIDFENLHTLLRSLYDEMMPLCSSMAGVARAIAGLGALFYIAYRVWQSLARAEAIDVFPLLRPFAIGLCILMFPTVVLGTLNAVMTPIVQGVTTMLDGEKLGYLGELHPQVADNYGIGERTYIAVLDMPAVVPHCTFDRKYEGVAKFPAVNRDISMVMDKNVLAGQIEEVIENKGGKLLESYKLFDVYEGAQIEQGKKSMAYTITFRAKDHTLSEEEITNVMNKILNALKDLGAELRS